MAVLGHHFEFQYDPMGNRLAANRNFATAVYTPNPLNQYEQREVPGFVQILGTADPEATVTVNQQPVLRQDGLFARNLPVDNTAADVYETVRIVGVKTVEDPDPVNYVSETEREVFVAETPETFTHDPDGNLIQDGRWNYTWDGQNRLVAMETRADLASVLPRQRLEFLYDSDGRRIRKEVFDWDAVSETFLPVSATGYLYHGWNLLAETDATGAIVRSYLWGISENGRHETTATPGALVGLYDHSDGAFYFAQSDGGGNIVALLASVTGDVAARYEYGPFGEPLAALGPMAATNPLRFSSKFLDTETGLYYYGHRFYEPTGGRFLNRDPIAEAGGINLYGFVGNDGINYIDLLGLSRWRSGGNVNPLNWPVPGLSLDLGETAGSFGAGGLQGAGNLAHGFRGAAEGLGETAAVLFDPLTRERTLNDIRNLAAQLRADPCLRAELALQLRDGVIDTLTDPDKLAEAIANASAGGALATLTGTGGTAALNRLLRNLPTSGGRNLVDTNTVRFTQRTAGRNIDGIASFSDGRPIQGLVDGLRSGAVSPLDVKPIRVFQRDGLTFTLDNRRLLAAQQAGLKVNTIPATAAEVTNKAL